MRFLSLSLGRGLVAALLLAALSALAGCTSPHCGDMDTTPHTVHYTITVARAAAIAAAADGGDGPTCRTECDSMTHPAGLARTCSVGGPTDGGVALTCTFQNVCR
jgi:hypothetical protein